MEFNTDTTTIVVTDPQIDYCHPDGRCTTELGWDISNLDEIADRLGHFIDMVKQDFNVVLLQNEEKESTYPLNMPFDSDFFVPFCVEGTSGHNFHPAINPDGCKVIKKNHPSGFIKEIGTPFSELENYLLSEGTLNILHAGFLAGRCVNATIIGASNMGFHNYVLTDLTGNPLGDKMQEEERVTRALWQSHYAKGMIDSSELKLS